MLQFGITQVAVAPIRKTPNDGAEMVSQLLFGEDVAIIEQNATWLKIKVVADGYGGFIDAKQVKIINEEAHNTWIKECKIRLRKNTVSISTESGQKTLGKGSIITEENVRKYAIEGIYASCTSLGELAKEYLNTPYLWGGRSVFGIDCSGLTQICCQLLGGNLSRDASTQVLEGKEIKFDEREAGDLAFFKNEASKVTHVGILYDKDTIIHASGWVRKDQFDEKGIFRIDTQNYTHKLFTLRRIKLK